MATVTTGFHAVRNIVVAGFSCKCRFRIEFGKSNQRDNKRKIGCPKSCRDCTIETNSVFFSSFFPSFAFICFPFFCVLFLNFIFRIEFFYVSRVKSIPCALPCCFLVRLSTETEPKHNHNGKLCTCDCIFGFNKSDIMCACIGRPFVPMPLKRGTVTICEAKMSTPVLMRCSISMSLERVLPKNQNGSPSSEINTTPFR